MSTVGKPRYDDDEEKDDGTGPGIDYVQKLDELMNRAEPLIFQVHSSYNQYASGTEMRPPVERAKQLDQIMNQLMLMAKPSPAYRFRFQSLQGTYTTYKKRWEKLLQDVDSGKIKRFAAPPKRRAG